LTAPMVTITGATPLDSPTSQTSWSVTFSSNENSTYQCALDGAPSTDCSTGSVFYQNLADGTHTLKVTATDLAGNVSAPASRSLIVDTTKPTVQITSVTPPASITNLTNISFMFTASEPGSFGCQLDMGQSLVCSPPQSYSGLTEGTHTFVVGATDNAGNQSASPATYSWTVDLTAPVTAITSETPSISPTSSTTETIAFGANENSTYQCGLDGSGLTPCTSPMTYNGLADGSHSFVVHATDVAGNTDPVGATYTWNISTVPLSVTNVVLSNVTSSSFTVTWTTNRPADTQGFWALYPSTTYSATPLDPTLVTNHSVTFTGLSSFTLYNVMLQSNDGAQTANSTLTVRTRP
jgi:large repetitive protein